MTLTCFLPDEAATVEFGKTLARATNGKGLITLSGNLGTGKTTMSRGIIQALGHEGPVKSPTYTLVESYETGEIRAFHFDLYRLEDPEELEFIGLWDYLDQNALILVEWPEKAFGVLPSPDLALTLESRDGGRQIICTPGNARGETLCAQLTHLYS